MQLLKHILWIAALTAVILAAVVGVWRYESPRLFAPDLQGASRSAEVRPSGSAENIPAYPELPRTRPVEQAPGPENLPGGGLPVEVVEAPLAPVSQPAPAATLAPTEVPQLAQTPPSVGNAPQQLRPIPPSNPLSIRVVPNAPLSTPYVAEEPQSRSEPIRRLSTSEPSMAAEPTNLNTASYPITQVNTLELIHRLPSGDQRAAEAQAELQRRGFTGRHFELARRMNDPDPRHRKELADQLPQLTGIDAIPWLVWLSGDPDADVRLAAINWMVTTDTPELLLKAEQIAAEDPDLRIRGQARRIAERRRVQRQPTAWR